MDGWFKANKRIFHWNHSSRCPFLFFLAGADLYYSVFLQRRCINRKWAVVHTRTICKNQPVLSSCSRLPLLEEWRGVRDTALSELSGIKDCIFVHTGGFIGGNKNQEGALEMARRTLQAAAQSPANGSSSWSVREDSQQHSLFWASVRRENSKD